MTVMDRPKTCQTVIVWTSEMLGAPCGRPGLMAVKMMMTMMTIMMMMMVMMMDDDDDDDGSPS